MNSTVGIDSTGSLCLCNNVLDILKGICLARVCECSDSAFVISHLRLGISDSVLEFNKRFLINYVLILKYHGFNLTCILFCNIFPLLSIVDVVLAVGNVVDILGVVIVLIRLQFA